MNKNQVAFVLTVLLITVGAACGQNSRQAVKTTASTDASPALSSECAPLETRTANVPEQKPAFPALTECLQSVVEQLSKDIRAEFPEQQ